jgi:hypothetical protein
VAVFRRLYEACMEHNLPIGVAPNVHVSLVLLPEECRTLMDNPRKYFWKELKLRAMGKAFGARFQRHVDRLMAQPPPTAPGGPTHATTVH